MGILRILLALSVILGHSVLGKMQYRPLLPGELAVELFFMISGFYMSLVLSGKYKNADASINKASFWEARALKIFPSYWIVLFVVLAWYALKNQTFYTHIADQEFWISLWLALSNACLLGLDGLLFLSRSGDSFSLMTSLDTTAGLQPYQLIAIAPAWTLSLELMFYLLAPCLVQWSSRKILTLIILSISARTILYSIGYDNDPWSYRFFPFEISFFLFGMLAHRLYAQGKLGSVWLSAPLFIGIFIFPYLPHSIVHGFWIEGSVLLFTGFIAIPSLFKRFRDSRADRTIGEISYPLYIVHMPVIAIAGPYLDWIEDPVSYAMIVVLLSVGAACIIQYTTEKILYWRSLRKPRIASKNIKSR